MSRRVLAVVVRSAASTEEVTRKVSMMTSMDIDLCKRLDEVDEVGILAWRSRGAKGKAHLRNRSAAHCPLLLLRSRRRPRRLWFRAFLCSSSSLALAIFGSLWTTCCSTTFCAPWWSVSASAIATVTLSCFARARSRRSPCDATLRRCRRVRTPWHDQWSLDKADGAC